MAYGLLELRPWEFWALTPDEFATMLEGYQLRTERQRERTAWMIHWLLLPHGGKNTPTIEEILGRTKTEQVHLPNGLTVTGDPGLIAALVGDGPQDTDRVKFDQLWSKVQKQREATE